MAKIAVELERALERRAKEGARGALAARLLAQGAGWSVEDVLCTSGPGDRAFEERHSCYRIAVVVAGSFQYRSHRGREWMTPGSLLLGNPGQPFECAHDHGTGDRCVSFGYSPEFFEAAARDSGTRPLRAALPRLRLPAMSELAPLVARACLLLETAPAAPATLEELGLLLAGRAMELCAGGLAHAPEVPPGASARIGRALRRIDADPSQPLALQDLARDARLSAFHFLRCFEQITGVTPHQYVRRARLRRAAVRIASGRERILDLALDCGFGDVANFNRAFRAEFGLTPRAWRARNAPPGPATAAFD